MRCVAVDWSGRAVGASEFIWVAEAVDGRLTSLRNGRTGDEVADWLIATRGDDLAVGLDFAFSVPEWYARRWPSAPAMWRAMADGEAERLLAAEEAPFWRRARPEQAAGDHGLRATEIDLRKRLGLSPKSVFQIGGSGAVGTGSLRGMGLLARLADEGFDVWPFTGRSLPAVIEIYPRALYPRRVVKTRWVDRHALLCGCWATTQPPGMLERAAGSEDAFDAAVSALAMSEHAGALRELPAAGSELERLEGRVWTPPL